MDDSNLRQLLEALEAKGVRYALFGATALNFLGLRERFDLEDP